MLSYFRGILKALKMLLLIENKSSSCYVRDSLSPWYPAKALQPINFPREPKLLILGNSLTFGNIEINVSKVSEYIHFGQPTDILDGKQKQNTNS